jgi:hypothetical protein
MKRLVMTFSLLVLLIPKAWAESPDVEAFPRCIKDLIAGKWDASHDISLNRVFRGDLNRLLVTEQYGMLDSIAAVLRERGTEFTNGDPAIYNFYIALGRVGLNGGVEELENPAGMAAKTILLNNWLQKDRSGTALIVMAEHQSSLAQNARGTGWASSVTAAGWEGLHTHNELCSHYCDEAEAILPNDPHLADLRVSLALNQDTSSGAVLAIADKVHRNYPKYPFADCKAAFYFLPRWQGEPGDLERWANLVASRPDGLGDEAYTRLAFSQAMSHDFGLLKETKLSWERIAHGYELMQKRHPNSQSNKSRWMYFLYMHGDMAGAAALYAHSIDFDRMVWGRRSRFDRCKADLDAWMKLHMKASGGGN